MAGQKVRGSSVTLPDWWMKELRERWETEHRDRKLTKTALGKMLSAAIARSITWDHKAVERFLDGEVTTFEMMVAFLRVWPSLLPPIFVAPERLDAERIWELLSRGDSNPEWRGRYLELEERLLQIAAPVKDQIGALVSQDAVEPKSGRQDGRRSRRVDRSRP